MTQPLQPITFTLDDRTAYSGPGLRALMNLESHLKLSEADMHKLLGKPGKAEFKEWRRAAKAKEPFTLPNDTLNRVRTSLLICQTLSKKWPKKPERVTDWIHSPHMAPVFQKKSPLTLMCDTDIQGILSVLRYVESFSNAPDPKKATPPPVRRKKTQAS